MGTARPHRRVQMGHRGFDCCRVSALASSVELQSSIADSLGFYTVIQK